MKDAPFYLFGLGNRDKYIYTQGRLYEFPSYRVAYTFDVCSERILPEEYRVELTLQSGDTVRIEEDSQCLSLTVQGKKTVLTESEVQLPRFEGHPFAPQLRILLGEILWNIQDGQPTPNLFVYPTPWYRDGAMVAMVLKATGNELLLKRWVDSLSDCYDRNNAGACEPDNLGQALYIISVCADRTHPLVEQLVAEGKRWVAGGMGGTTDSNHHPVYCAKWLKYGLEALGLDSSWVPIPQTEDFYLPLFHMNCRGVRNGDTPAGEPGDYPYLWWADRHFYGEKAGESRLSLTYPMSCEAHASEAKYSGLLPLFPGLYEEKKAAPHTWHACEMFLYLTDPSILKLYQAE